MQPHSSPLFLLAVDYPPVPKKLVSRVQEGLFVEMAELLSHKLISAEYFSGDHSTNPRKQRYEVSNILEWVHCFGIYVAIIFQKEPERTADSGLPTTYNPLFFELSWRWLASIWQALPTESSSYRVERLINCWYLHLENGFSWQTLSSLITANYSIHSHTSPATSHQPEFNSMPWQCSVLDFTA